MNIKGVESALAAHRKLETAVIEADNGDNHAEPLAVQLTLKEAGDLVWLFEKLWNRWVSSTLEDL